ncbi:MULTISPECIES: DNA primase [unclassified Burkholderia]|uniref:DNA primase n=1 Tax=unclassified Burkholderia TaxID=2613784 RepID=UPI002AAFEF14|nr:MULTISPECIES: CHC2 zinc finger domain-containing protein [unclassified Burkholderia]
MRSTPPSYPPRSAVHETRTVRSGSTAAASPSIHPNQRYPEHFLRRVAEATDLVGLVGQTVALKKAGKEYVGLCPFHGEKHPSFSVNGAEGVYYCFGCGARGDAFAWLVDYGGYGFREAVEILAQHAGIALPTTLSGISPNTSTGPVPPSKALGSSVPTPAAPLAPRPKSSEPEIELDGARADNAYAIMEVAAQFYERALRESPEAIAYARGRGLTGKTAKRFRMGYAPAEWQGLEEIVPDYMRSAALADAGLVIDKASINSSAAPLEGRTGTRRYDRFRDRLMFPVRDLRGRVIAFGARLIRTQDSIDGESGHRSPKYLNSPETALFHKSRVLFGLYEAAMAIRARRRGPTGSSGSTPSLARARTAVYVVEGYMDVVALSQGGIPEAVATMGTAVQISHVEQLRRIADDIVFVFDGDAAGDKAARAALEICLPMVDSGSGQARLDRQSTRYFFVRLPDGMDPDDVIKRDGEALWRSMPRRALAEFLIEQAYQQCGTRDLTAPDIRAAFLAEGKQLAMLMPKGSDLRRIVLTDLHRLAGVDAYRTAGEGRDEPSNAMSSKRAHWLAPSRRTPGMTASSARLPEANLAEPYARLAEACARQPQRAVDVVPVLVAHLQRCYGDDPEGWPSTVHPLLKLLESLLESQVESHPEAPVDAGAGQARAGALPITPLPSPADIAMLDSLEAMLRGIESDTASTESDEDEVGRLSRALATLAPASGG